VMSNDVKLKRARMETANLRLSTPNTNTKNLGKLRRREMSNMIAHQCELYEFLRLTDLHLRYGGRYMDFLNKYALKSPLFQSGISIPIKY